MRTLYCNGRVYTGTLPLVSAFAVEDGRFVFAGSDAEGEALGWDERVDLGGRFVCAGFNDSHMHLLNYGQSLSMAELASHTGSLRELVDHMKAFAASLPYIPLCWRCGLAAYDRALTNVTPTGYDPYAGLDKWNIIE